MMNTLSQKKLTLMALVFSMLFVFSRVLTIAMRYSASPSIYIPAVKAAIVKRVKKAVQVHVAKAEKVEKPVNDVQLRSYLRTYDYQFSGKVECRSTPCAAQVQLILNTDQNPNVRKVVKTSPDGTYSITLSLKDFMHGQVDWKLTARDETSRSAEEHGRQILMEDPTVTVENTLQLS